MQRVSQDVESIISLKEKEKLLKALHQEDLLELFKTGFKPNYKKIEPKQTVLDQQISITINAVERDIIKAELNAIAKIGDKISLSNFIRNRTSSLVDIEDWATVAKNTLVEYSSSDWDLKHLEKEKRKYIRLIDEEEENSEDFIIYNKKLKELDDKIAQIKRKTTQRKFRISTRVTYSEANVIRWRAARLSLSVADYMRMSLFGYLPNSEGDQHLTMPARKRFYVSVLDVQQNGWGDVPTINECPHCARYQKENALLKDKLKRYETLYKNQV